jgi:hypothetical protein
VSLLDWFGIGRENRARASQVLPRAAPSRQPCRVCGSPIVDGSSHDVCGLACAIAFAQDLDWQVESELGRDG